MKRLLIANALVYTLLGLVIAWGYDLQEERATTPPSHTVIYQGAATEQPEAVVEKISWNRIKPR